MKLVQGAIFRVVLEAMASGQEDSDEASVLEKFCKLHVELEKHISSEVVANGGVKWVDAAHGTLARLDQAITCAGKGWATRAWKSSGPEEIVPVLQNCKWLPDGLQSVYTIAKNAGLIQGLEAVKVDPSDFNQILSCVKKGLTVATLNQGVISEFFNQEDVDKLLAYKNSMIASLEKAVQNIEECQSNIGETIDKYRRRHD